jgi:hypothetical protein
MIRVHDDAVRMFVIRALGKFPMWSYSEGLSSFSLACSSQYSLSPKSNCKVNRFSLLLSIVIGLATAEKKQFISTHSLKRLRARSEDQDGPSVERAGPRQVD